MFVKNISIITFLAVVLAVSAQGATVSFMVIETGLREETPTIESSRLWEDALLGVFFDTGHIVSNTPILRVSQKPQKNLPDEAKASLGEALDGGADFFILAVLDYENQPKIGMELPKPRSISIRLFKTEPYRFLFSQEYTPAAEVHTTDRDDMANAMSAARVIAAHLKD
ncbi:hypothetical protein [Treponema primitia]|uniref:hypothetical protein n=1 Tax=Treponema primitia TaxID=88058 RepID=UPI0002555609|nr:hypothetical protein [Treponema primitia]